MNKAEVKEPIDKIFNVMLVLLKMGLWGYELKDSSIFPLSGREWVSVFNMANRQTILGIVYNGICQLPYNLLPPEAILLRWVAEVEMIERKNKKMNLVISKLYETFNKYNITTVLKKGQGVGMFYINPLLRECGDIDLYFPDKDEYRRAITIIKNMGYNCKFEADGSVSYTIDGICVEHHSQLIDICNPLMKSYLADLERMHGYDTFPLVSNERFMIMVPSTLLNLLLLNTHIMKHSVGLGIGLRQLCDISRAYCCLNGDAETKELKAAICKLGIRKWTNLLHSFLIDYLGMPSEYLPYKDKHISSRPLLDIIIAGGNFGQRTSKRSNVSKSVWQRKLQTSRAFIQRASFSCRYVPMETFWTFTKLLTGQFKC